MGGEGQPLPEPAEHTPSRVTPYPESLAVAPPASPRLRGEGIRGLAAAAVLLLAACAPTVTDPAAAGFTADGDQWRRGRGPELVVAIEAAAAPPTPALLSLPDPVALVRLPCSGAVCAGLDAALERAKAAAGAQRLQLVAVGEAGLPVTLAAIARPDVTALVTVGAPLDLAGLAYARGVPIPQGPTIQEVLPDLRRIPQRHVWVRGGAPAPAETQIRVSAALASCPGAVQILPVSRQSSPWTLADVDPTRLGRCPAR